MRDNIDLLVKKSIPLFAILIACVGGSCFTIFAPVETVAHAKAIQYSIAGILGTLAVFSLVRKSLNLEPDDDFFGFRGGLIAFLLCLCWGLGAIGGFILFYFIPRHAV
jgi:hypothetical protein